MAKDKIKYIIGKVNEQLMDDGFVRWPEEKLLEYFNSAQRAVVISRPDAFVVEKLDFACAAGARQQLPEDGLRLIDVRGDENGNVARNRTRRELTELYPNWLGLKDNPAAEAFVYDEREPLRFFLFPGVTAGLKLEIVYSATPPVKVKSDLDANADTDLSTIYTPAIIEYMLYTAHSKDFEYSELQKAQNHLAMFNNLIGTKSQADAAMTPTDKG
jgi:hypothetical protein